LGDAFLVAQDGSSALVVVDEARELDSALLPLVEFGFAGCGGCVAGACRAAVGGDAPGGDCAASALMHYGGVKQEGDAAFGG